MNEEPWGANIVTTLAELRALGEFARHQDIGPHVADLIAAHQLPNGYPLIASRLPANPFIDLFVDGRWRKVRFVRTKEGSWPGDKHVVYIEQGMEKTQRYDRNGIAPVGHFTEWMGARPESLDRAELTDQFVPEFGHRMISQRLVEEDWPYLTFKVRTFESRGLWADNDDVWTASHTIHVADPRVKVEGVRPRESWFNTTIAVSHRWLSPEHPDPDRTQYAEFMALCESLGLHDTQTFLLDYCSLPQKPRSPNEELWFVERLPQFQAQFGRVALVLNMGSADYSQRAWCMLELLLAQMNRAPRSTILNNDKLEGPLREASQLAAHYVRHRGWNNERLLKAFADGVTSSSFSKWSRNAEDLAVYNASIDGRRAILRMFEHELAVTDPNDKPIILSLLEQVAFRERRDFRQASGESVNSGARP